MRPKIAMWSDYRSPTRKRWKSPYRRSTRPSIGLRILLVAVVLVAGVIGISGIYPQIIDSEWVRNAGTHAKRPAIAEVTTRRAVGPIAAVPLSPRGGASTTGDAVASAPRAVPPTPVAPAAVEPPKGPSPLAAAADALASETTPPPLDTPDAQAVADPPKPAVADGLALEVPTTSERRARGATRHAHPLTNS